MAQRTVGALRANKTPRHFSINGRANKDTNDPQGQKAPGTWHPRAMSGRQSSAVDRAIRLVLAGKTRAQAARATGIHSRTIYRAWKRHLERNLTAPSDVR